MPPNLILIDTGLRHPYQLEITQHEVPMRGLPDALQGTVVVHLTDLHGGYGNTGAVHQEVVDRLHEIQPDLILLTGDYIDDHRTVKDYPIEEMLSQLRAPLGVFGSFGNHDHRRGVVGTRRKLEQAGIQVLDNESREVPTAGGQGLWIAGVDDLEEGEPDIEKALANLPTDATSIVLSHNPRLIEMVAERDVFILSGHTHGGQIALPFPTPKMVCLWHLRCRQVAGWYANGRARSYVSRGIGVTGKPFRYRCPAEIAVFRLVQQQIEAQSTPEHE